MQKFFVIIVISAVGLILAAIVQGQEQGEGNAPVANGALISASTTMTTAWDLPKNPLVDSLPYDRNVAEQIRWGFRLFTNTPLEAPQFTPNKMSCSNCHLNAGQREKALPLVGVAGAFPEYNKRAGRLFSLEDRIVGCFARSQNATGSTDGSTSGDGEGGVPSTSSKEVLAISAYIAWLSQGHETWGNIPWRGQNVISQDKLIPVGKLDTSRGGALFKEKCGSCHGEDGQGVAIGDKMAGPLWGPHSWNDGAGAARIYTLAGMIRYTMPYLNPGSLTDEEAQLIAAYINAKPRPEFPHKEKDYLAGSVPPDAVYYQSTREEKKKGQAH